MTVQRIPSKPDYLSQQNFDFIISRDGHRCVNYGDCLRANGSACCDETLDFDHAQPRELGGDDTAGNIRLLCSCVNRGRAVEPLKKWDTLNYWDAPVVPARLREIQRLAGWDAISELNIEHPKSLRRVLLGNTTFLAGATGIGKTILCQSVFFKINQIIGRGFPRICNVLWLTNDTHLRDSGRVELETDTVDIRFANAGPTVHVAQSFADISLGPNGSDIKISAVQSAWKVKEGGGGNDRHSDIEIKRALLQYDTIVFDECDWANDQMRRIAQLGDHALQFALTASPPIEDLAGDIKKAQEFLRRFVLITPKAIADYKRAVELDSCLKLVDDNIIIAAKHDGYVDRQRGVLTEHSGRMIQTDHVLSRAAIAEAVIAADHLETRMKTAVPDRYFSPHIMVRMSRIADLRAMREDLTEQLAAAYARREIQNPGWSVSMIFQGHTRERKDVVSYDEYDLSAKDSRGHWRHPFMRARNNNGRVIDGMGSKRILLMCNIGVRGLNNWTVAFIVDCTDTIQPVELIQFDEGRPLRWVSDRADWIDAENPESEFSQFAKAHVFIPTSGFQDNKRAAILHAREFVKDMLSRIGNAGFLTWQDLLNGRRVTDEDVVIDPTNRALTDVERFKVQNCLGVALAATGQSTLTPAQVDAAIDQNGAFRHSAPMLHQRLIDYAQRLLDKPSFRQRELTAAPTLAEFQQFPASVMEKLKPQDNYDHEDLVRWVKSDPTYDGIRDDYLTALQEQNRIAVHAVSKSLRERQMANYRPAARTRTLQGTGTVKGVLPEVASELMKKLNDAGTPCDVGKAFHAVNGAANKIFQINAEDGGPMDAPAYHIAILGRYRESLQTLARSKLIADGDLGQHLKRLADL